MIIVAASQNKHKIMEMEAITKQFGMEIVGRDDFGVPKVEIVEDGVTFEENSLKKAEGVMKLCGKITIADDSGIVVDALDGAPGVYSARFSGEECDDNKNNQKLLEMLEDVPMEKRTARYVAVITMAFPDGRVLVARGECEGHILLEESGQNGFGYDPLFRPVGYPVSFGEIPPEEKNKISHRAKALIELQKQLEKLGKIE
ncbi:XTP/dITP diphosphatase [Clostridium aminobutyricum]|uniref:dITP/XTP pyrophosphatase n=1 Tax=Clostridium aminobutyricum TaxID=33953 RepID=A0A939IJ63_CLOAM|nr:XTP/dITP diphosphatase [Clostridium aminobutyricum]MBN7773786.1 XTP/dITP diphosphatase [Clostridium aminobutyricum]